MSKAEFFFIQLYNSFKQIQQKRRRNGRSTTKLSVEVALRQIKKEQQSWVVSGQFPHCPFLSENNGLQIQTWKVLAHVASHHTILSYYVLSDDIMASLNGHLAIGWTKAIGKK